MAFCCFAHVPAHGTHHIAHSLGRTLLCASEESSGYLYPPITHLLVHLNNLPFTLVLLWVCSNTCISSKSVGFCFLKRYRTHGCSALTTGSDNYVLSLCKRVQSEASELQKRCVAEVDEESISRRNLFNCIESC